MERKAVLCSVGDLMLSDSPLYVSIGVGSKYAQIKNKIFSECTDVFQSAGVTIGNFESNIYHPKNRSVNEFQMSCPEEVIADLSSTGFNVLNFANNHCMQHGAKAFLSGMELCGAIRFPEWIVYFYSEKARERLGIDR